jgi:YebC/PmpR family DNA-binding regulatory protein
MSGHSKWATIKRQKARVDAAKGATSAKMSRAIIVAARTGVPDPAKNFQLRTAIENAKAASVPKENIERAIAKGAGTLGGEDALESIRYEGYGAGGVAVIVEALTDNRHRTAGDLRSAFGKRGGNMGETGCVGWMFDQKGVVTVKAHPPAHKKEQAVLDEEALLEAALEGGAESYEMLEVEEEIPGAEIFIDPTQLESLTQTLKDQGYWVTQAGLRWIPNNSIEVTDGDQARSLLRMMDALEELDDVQSVTANFEMTDELMTASMIGW